MNTAIVLLRLLATALLLLGAAAARAEPATVVASAHEGTFTGTTIEWTSTFVAVPGIAGRDREIVLAAPLGTDVEVVSGASPVRSPDGRIVALALASHAGRVTVRLRQPAMAGPVTLAAPVAAGEAVQRVTLDGGRFRADRGLGVEERLGWSRQPEIDRRERRATDRQLGLHFRPSDQAIYLRGDARIADAGGLVGGLQAGGRPPYVAMAIGGLFVLLVAGMGVSVRALGRQAKAESVDAYIRDEFVRSRRP